MVVRGKIRAIKEMKTTDPSPSERPFLTRLGLRLVAVIAGCAAALLLAYLIMLPTMLLGIKLGPGLGSTAWGLGIGAGYLVYRLLCKRFKLILRSKSGLDELFEKEENEVANSTSSLHESNGHQIMYGALTENETLPENEDATDPTQEITEDVILDENEIKPITEPKIEEEEAPQNEEQFQRVEEVSSISNALSDTEKESDSAIIESVEPQPNKAPKRRNNKRIKNVCLIISSVFLVVGLAFAAWVINLRINAKTEHEQLVQSIKEKIAEGTITRNEVEECIKTLEYCEENHSYCNFNHQKTIEKMLDSYIQHLVDYCKTNVEKSVIVATQLFKWDRTDMGRYCDKYYKGEKSESIGYEYVHNYTKIAVKILENAAEGPGVTPLPISIKLKGDADSQFALGCFYAGSDYSSDEIIWRSYTMLGNNVDYKKAAYWYLQAAEQGHSAAMGNLGSAYMKGSGVPQDEEKGIYWIQKAANLGNAFFQRRLGDYYSEGIQVESGSHKETRKSTEYRFDMIRCYWDYSRGQTIYVYQVDVPDYKTILPKDIEQAKYWWKLAANNGDETAKERLSQLPIDDYVRIRD